MTILNAGDISSLRSGLSAALNAQTLTVEPMTAQVAGTPYTISAIVSESAVGYAQDQDGERYRMAYRISVRPLEDETIQIGDRITYGSNYYFVQSITGTDVRKLLCEYLPDKGLQRQNRFRGSD